MRFLGCCWNKSTRLLMYDYMANGSLGAVLHERRGAGAQLEWDVRYRIVLGAAQGIALLICMSQTRLTRGSRALCSRHVGQNLVPMSYGPKWHTQTTLGYQKYD